MGETFNLYNHQKNKSAGVYRVEGFNKRLNYQFTDYLRGGLNISVITCIDFTGSNGIPSSSSSLHYMSPGGLNQYQQAITSVCSILLNYDYDKMIQTYGFGAKTRFPQMAMNQTSHFFPCSGDFQNCAGAGVEGVFQLYNQAIMNVELSGPTYFSPLLSEVTSFTAASAQQNPDTYTVLLILTDGEIHDMDKTVSQIVDASNLPMSIIIVGVGRENFRNMVRLDSDDSILRDTSGRKASRDIVQFVPFRNFQGKGAGALAEEVLRELPRQVTNYYSLIGKPPNKPIEVNPDHFMQVQQKVGINLVNNLGLQQDGGPTPPPLVPPPLNQGGNDEGARVDF